MSSSDTDRFYTLNATDYAASGSHRPNLWRERFLSMLQPCATILELGCGGGYDAEAMLARGFNVTATDGTAEMAMEAERRLGREVAVLRFDGIAFENAFDGVFASACLLHVPRADLSGILARILRALHPGGVFYASFKAGTAEGTDGLGRYYNYPDKDWLYQTCKHAGWPSAMIEMADGTGYDRKPTRWLHLFAQA